MRVVFLRSNPVDPDPRVEKEASTLIKAGYDVSVVAWDRDGKYRVKEDYLNLDTGKAKIYRLGILASFGGGFKENLKPLFLFQLAMLRWLFMHRRKYDVIHACDFDTAFVAGYCAKILRKKLVYDIFDYYVDSFNVPKKLRKLVEMLDRAAINSASGVIICSEKRKEQIAGSKPKKLTVIHNSPSSYLPTSHKVGNGNKVKIAYVGILSEGRLLRELADLITKDDKLELHIGGFGKLQGHIKQLDAEYSNIFYYGKLGYKQTLELENNCDIMTAIYDPLIPNHYYAAPNKFYESLMLGKPIIVVKNTGIDEIVQETNIGAVIDYNQGSLIEGIEELIGRKDDWPSISLKMKEIFRKYYSWGEMEKRLSHFYREIT